MAPTRRRKQIALASRLPRPALPAPPDRFDRWAPTYDTSSLQRVLYRPVHKAILQHAGRHAPDPAQILDIGCGTGLLLHSAAQTYPHADLVGIDPSAQMVGQAAQTMRCPAPPHAGHGLAEHTTERTIVRFARARAEALPFRDATFDLVLSTMSLRHWHDPRQALAEISRVITCTGVVAIADLVQPPARRHTPRWLPHAPQRSNRVSLPTSLTRAITAAGLRPEHIEPIHLTIPVANITVIVARRLQQR